MGFEISDVVEDYWLVSLELPVFCSFGLEPSWKRCNGHPLSMGKSYGISAGPAVFRAIFAKIPAFPHSTGVCIPLHLVTAQAKIVATGLQSHVLHFPRFFADSTAVCQLNFGRRATSAGQSL